MQKLSLWEQEVCGTAEVTLTVVVVIDEMLSVPWVSVLSADGEKVVRNLAVCDISLFHILVVVIPDKINWSEINCINDWDRPDIEPRFLMQINVSLFSSLLALE